MDYSKLGFREIILTLDGSVAVVTLNRDEQRNIFNIALALEIIRAFELCDQDDRVRVVIMTAQPGAPAYCSGADLSTGWKGLGVDSPFKLREPGVQVATAINNCRKITFAAVNGHAAGIGMTGMQLPFDYRFAWEGAKLIFPFVRRGIAPEALSTYFLPRLLGLARAKAIFLTAASLNPQSPVLRDLYYQTFPKREDVFPASLAFAKELAANTSQTAVALTKGLLNHPPATIEETLELESRSLTYLSQQNDAAEAGKAFLERRPAKLSDRLSEVATEWYPWWNQSKAKL